MLKTDFSQQNEDEGKAPLQPGDHCLQLRQSGSRGGLVFLGLLPGAVPLRASGRRSLLEERGGPVLQGLVVEVVVVVMVVLRWAREKGPTLRAVGAAFFSGRRGHLDKYFRGGAQD